jgi:hypothetical protein
VGEQTVTDTGRAQSVAQLLEKLLLEREEYAERWQYCQRRARPAGALNQAAIAQVLAEHLWDTGERSERETDLPRILKDGVHRALQGKGISPQTLTWFIDAFDMTQDDARQLRAALSGPLPPNGTPVTGTLRLPQQLPIPQRHRTLAVFERRVIGPDGAPVTHHVSRAIVAQKGTVSFYPCRQFADASEVKMLCGGTITARHEPPGSSPILEITLSRPLPMGQVGSLEYQANFGPDASVVTEYRQVAHARADNVDIVVQFDHKRMPRQVWWAIWDDYRDGTVLAEQPVTLDPDRRVHRYLPYLENAAVGFRWEW